MTPEKLLGQQLDSYRLEAVLGRGGMAVVYRARGPEGKEVALKVLFPPPEAEAELRLRFQREARTAARLRHSGIMPVLEAGQAEGYAYLAMPLIEGQTLAERLAQQLPEGLDETTAADIAWQMADALDYAHRQGVVHRDVKPSNILLSSEGRAILADFGVAQALDDPSLTRTGLTVGTPAYMAPEQVSGDQPVDGRADLYALGVVLYQMVTGRTPFRGTTPAVLHAHLYEAPPPPSSITPISAAMEAVIVRALAKEAGERFQTGAAMAQALAALEGQTGTQVQLPPPAQPAPATGQRRWLWLIPAVLLAGLGLWQLNGAGLAGPGFTPSPNPISTGTVRLSTSIALSALTPSPTLPPTFTSTPSATLTPTLEPSATPTPTVTPASPSPSIEPDLPETPVAALTPSPTACPLPLDPTFASLLNDAGLAERLGCPQEEAFATAAAWQPFEHGHLLWRQDLKLIYILRPDNTWRFIGDPWREGDVEPPSTAPEGLYQPVRGFGRTWLEQPGVQQALGWGIGEEQGFMATLQEFDGGTLWQTPEQVFILFQEGTYRIKQGPEAPDDAEQ